MRITRCLACTLTLLGLCALPLMAAANDCPSVDGIDSICGLAAPEDLVPAPNGRDLIFGQMAGPPLGAGTVALQRGNFFYIGSYVGDRIVRLPLPGSSGQ